MKKKYDIVTALDLCVDFLVQCGRVVPEFGQKEQIVEDYNIELGGSCSIFACQAAKLGLKTLGVGVVGEDSFGGVIMDKLSGAGVITDRIKVDSSYKTGMGAILCLDGGDRAILTYNGTIDAVGSEDISDDIILDTRHIHIGSYYLMKKLQLHYLEIVIKAKKAGATVSLDTNWDPEEKWDSGIWDIMPYVDIFLPNENEAKLIARKSSPEEALKFLSDKVPVIGLKLGKGGGAAYAGGTIYKAPPVDVKVVDTVGAGDSFDAGFVYGYLSGYDMNKCLQIGCICGSLNTSRAGGIAGQPDLNDVLKIIGEGR